ncbi:hypothetical protein [Novosphingobium cyanobacteriorum]|uniref:Uncharacterized protein n=1 Tax=Novosphingobium cyanobacteriorum TaxID=3024215 RepID=A0ABT6CDG8_9SPHN|nr:hypothetical protein [Novosphingobium cyanobacteriorum]MDF8331972.1 hypothetical protein [Novosphingobium cyanobacteriorum]
MRIATPSAPALADRESDQGNLQIALAGMIKWRRPMVAKWVAKIAFLGGCFVTLTAAKLGLYELPDSIVPDEKLVLGEPLVAKLGQPLVSARLVHTVDMVLDQPINAKMGKFSRDFAVGDRLTPMIVSDESKSLVGENSEIFCGKEIESRSKVANAIWGNFLSKYDKTVKFCFADTNGDMKIDRMLLAGSFEKSLQEGITIEPLGYHLESLKPERDDDIIYINYEKNRNGKLILWVFYRKSGIHYSPNGYSTPERFGKNSYGFFREIDTRGAKFPILVDDVLGASLQVDGVDPDGSIIYRLTKNFSKTLVKPLFTQQYTLYVYY